MEGHDSWQAWAQALERRRLKYFTAAFLEAAGPLTLLLSQLTIITQPFFGKLLPTGQWEEIARLLEDGNESRLFVAFLQEDKVD